jgi:hypothetical protein
MRRNAMAWDLVGSIGWDRSGGIDLVGSIWWDLVGSGARPNLHGADVGGRSCQPDKRSVRKQEEFPLLGRRQLARDGDLELGGRDLNLEGVVDGGGEDGVISRQLRRL